MPNELSDVTTITDERTMLDEKPSDEKVNEGNDSGDENDSKIGIEDEEEVEEEDEQVEGEEKEEEETEEEGTEDEEVENDSLYQQLKKRDAKLLKEIPELRSVIFREQKFTEIFPSIEDAQSAREAADIFASYEKDLMAGDSTGILETLEKTDKKSLEAFVANFIPNVEKQNKQLYLEMLYPEFKKMLRAATKSKDARLVTSAENLNWFIFGDTDVEADAGLKPTKRDEKDDALSKREKEFESRITATFENDVITTIEKRFRNIVGSAFKDSDVSPLLQKSLIKEIMERVDSAITKDTRHMGNVKNLWDKARKAGFTTDWKDSIQNAYLSRAKVLIPKIRQQVLSEAKLSGKAIKETIRPVRIPTSGSTQRSGSGKVDVKKLDMSRPNAERELLEGKMVLKK